MLKEFYINHPYLSRYILFVSVHLLTIAFYFVSSYLFDIYEPLWTIVWVLIPTAISLIIVLKLIHFFANGRDVVFCIFWLLSIILCILNTIRPATDLLKIKVVEVNSLQEAFDIKDGMFKAKFDFDLDYDNVFFYSEHICSYGLNKIKLTAEKYQKKLYFPLKNVESAVYQWNYGEPENTCFAKGFEKVAKSEAREIADGKLPKYFTLQTKEYEWQNFDLESDNFDSIDGNTEFDGVAYNRHCFKYLIIGQDDPGYLAFMKILKSISIISVWYLILGLCIIWFKKS